MIPALVKSVSGYVTSTGGTATIDCTGADFLLVKLLWGYSSGVLQTSAPTIAGATLTKIIETDAYQAHAAIYSVVNPAQSSLSVSIAGQSSGNTTYILEAWKNVDGTTPTGSAVSNTPSSTFPTSLNVSSVTSNDVVNATYFAGYYDTNATWGQTVSVIESGAAANTFDYSSVSLTGPGNPLVVSVTSGGGANHVLVALRINGKTAATAANGIPSLTVESKSGTLLASGTSVSVTVDTTTGTNVYAKTALTITSANQIPVIDLSSAVTAGTVANGDTVNYRVDYGGETTIVPQTVVASPT